MVDHREYTNQLRVYEEGEDVTSDWLNPTLHGAAVASIAVGNTVGVAPEADLYFIAMGDCGGAASIQNFDFTCLAKDVLRIISINKDFRKIGKSVSSRCRLAGSLSKRLSSHNRRSGQS